MTMTGMSGSRCLAVSSTWMPFRCGIFRSVMIRLKTSFFKRSIAFRGSSSVTTSWGTLSERMRSRSMSISFSSSMMRIFSGIFLFLLEGSSAIVEPNIAGRAGRQVAWTRERRSVTGSPGNRDLVAAGRRRSEGEDAPLICDAVLFSLRYRWIVNRNVTQKFHSTGIARSTPDTGA